MHRGTGCALRDTGAAMVGVDAAGTQTLYSGVKQDAVQLAPMDADFGQRITRMATAGLPVNELAKAVEEHTLQVFNAHGFQLSLKTQACELTHGVRQQRDAHAQLAHLGHAFIHIAGHTPLVQRQCKAQPRNAATNNGNTGHWRRQRRHSAVMPLRWITSPQRG